MASKRSTCVDNRLAFPEEEETTSSVEEEQGESESGTESEDVPTSNVKPIDSQPMEETPSKSKKPSKGTAKKRGSEVNRDEKDSKRSKVKDLESNGAEDTKTQLFQRKWSEDDEVALLKGLLSFGPPKDMNAFHDFIKKSLHFDVSSTQVKYKLWRLKKKFGNHVKKDKKGEGKTFSKPHDQELFDLSKMIWGSEGVSKSLKKESSVGEKEDEKMEKIETEMQKHGKFYECVSVGTMEDYVIKRGLDFVEGAEKSKMQEKWRMLRLAELELFIKREELIMEQAKLMLASWKSMRY